MLMGKVPQTGNAPGIPASGRGTNAIPAAPAATPPFVGASGGVVTQYCSYGQSR